MPHHRIRCRGRVPRRFGDHLFGRDRIFRCTWDRVRVPKYIRHRGLVPGRLQDRHSFNDHVLRWTRTRYRCLRECFRLGDHGARCDRLNASVAFMYFPFAIRAIPSPTEHKFNTSIYQL